MLAEASSTIHGTAEEHRRPYRDIPLKVVLFAACGPPATAKFPPGDAQHSAPDATGVLSGLSPRPGHAEGGEAR